jgi:hypothetical protein
MYGLPCVVVAATSYFGRAEDVQGYPDERGSFLRLANNFLAIISLRGMRRGKGEGLITGVAAGVNVGVRESEHGGKLPHAGRGERQRDGCFAVRQGQLD